MADLVFQVRVSNVPEGLAHKPRAEEIAELPQFLEVVSAVAPDLALINVGEEEPPADRAGFPWLKLNASNEPLGLYYNVGGIWQPAQNKYFLTDLEENIVVERGTITVTMNVAAKTPTVTATAVPFSEEFDDIPNIFLQIIGGTILSQSDGYATSVYPEDVTVAEFKIKSVSTVNTGSTAQTVQVRWMAMGKRS